MCQKDADRMANSIDPDQTAPPVANSVQPDQTAPSDMSSCPKTYNHYATYSGFRICWTDPTPVSFVSKGCLIYLNLVTEIPLTTVHFLNIRTPQKFVVITLKFELCGSTIE